MHNINLDELKKLLLKYKNILTKLNGDVTDKGSDGWYYVSVGMKERWGPPISPYFFQVNVNCPIYYVYHLNAIKKWTERSAFLLG